MPPPTPQPIGTGTGRGRNTRWQATTRANAGGGGGLAHVVSESRREPRNLYVKSPAGRGRGKVIKGEPRVESLAPILPALKQGSPGYIEEKNTATGIRSQLQALLVETEGNVHAAATSVVPRPASSVSMTINPSVQTVLSAHPVRRSPIYVRREDFAGRGSKYGLGRGQSRGHAGPKRKSALIVSRDPTPVTGIIRAVSCPPTTEARPDTIHSPSPVPQRLVHTQRPKGSPFFPGNVDTPLSPIPTSQDGDRTALSQADAVSSHDEVTMRSASAMQTTVQSTGGKSPVRRPKSVASAVVDVADSPAQQRARLVNSTVVPAASKPPTHGLTCFEDCLPLFDRGHRLDPIILVPPFDIHANPFNLEVRAEPPRVGQHFYILTSSSRRGLVHCPNTGSQDSDGSHNLQQVIQRQDSNAISMQNASEFIPLQTWATLASQWTKLRELTFFRLFRARKALTAWKSYVRGRRFRSAVKEFAQSSLRQRPVFAEGLTSLVDVLVSVESAPFDPESMTKLESYLSWCEQGVSMVLESIPDRLAEVVNTASGLVSESELVIPYKLLRLGDYMLSLGLPYLMWHLFFHPIQEALTTAIAKFKIAWIVFGADALPKAMPSAQQIIDRLRESRYRVIDALDAIPRLSECLLPGVQQRCERYAASVGEDLNRCLAGPDTLLIKKRILSEPQLAVAISDIETQIYDLFLSTTTASHPSVVNVLQLHLFLNAFDVIAFRKSRPSLAQLAAFLPKVDLMIRKSGTLPSTIGVGSLAVTVIRENRSLASRLRDLMQALVDILKSSFTRHLQTVLDQQADCVDLARDLQVRPKGVTAFVGYQVALARVKSAVARLESAGAELARADDLCQRMHLTGYAQDENERRQALNGVPAIVIAAVSKAEQTLLGKSVDAKDQLETLLKEAEIQSGFDFLETLPFCYVRDEKPVTLVPILQGIAERAAERANVLATCVGYSQVFGIDIVSHLGEGAAVASLEDGSIITVQASLSKFLLDAWKQRADYADRVYRLERNPIDSLKVKVEVDGLEKLLHQSYAHGISGEHIIARLSTAPVSRAFTNAKVREMFEMNNATVAMVREKVVRPLKERTSVPITADTIAQLEKWRAERLPLFQRLATLSAQRRHYQYLQTELGHTERASLALHMFKAKQHQRLINHLYETDTLAVKAPETTSLTVTPGQTSAAGAHPQSNLRPLSRSRSRSRSDLDAPEVVHSAACERQFIITLCYGAQTVDSSLLKRFYTEIYPSLASMCGARGVELVVNDYPRHRRDAATDRDVYPPVPQLIAELDTSHLVISLLHLEALAHADTLTTDHDIPPEGHFEWAHTLARDGGTSYPELMFRRVIDIAVHAKERETLGSSAPPLPGPPLTSSLPTVCLFMNVPDTADALEISTSSVTLGDSQTQQGGASPDKGRLQRGRRKIRELVARAEKMEVLHTEALARPDSFATFKKDCLSKLKARLALNDTAVGLDPDTTPPSETLRLQAHYEATVLNRVYEFYVPRPAYSLFIENYATYGTEGNGCLFLLGKNGSGKTALLANLMRTWSNNPMNKNDPVMTVVGSGPWLTDIRVVLSRLIYRLRDLRREICGNSLEGFLPLMEKSMTSLPSLPDPDQVIPDSLLQADVTALNAQVSMELKRFAEAIAAEQEPPVANLMNKSVLNGGGGSMLRPFPHLQRKSGNAKSLLSSAASVAGRNRGVSRAFSRAAPSIAPSMAAPSVIGDGAPSLIGGDDGGVRMALSPDAEGSQIILVIDGLDRLELVPNVSITAQLGWLLEPMPQPFRVIASCTDDPRLAELIDDARSPSTTPQVLALRDLPPDAGVSMLLRHMPSEVHGDAYSLHSLVSARNAFTSPEYVRLSVALSNARDATSEEAITDALMNVGGDLEHLVMSSLRRLEDQFGIGVTRLVLTSLYVVTTGMTAEELYHLILELAVDEAVDDLDHTIPRLEWTDFVAHAEVALITTGNGEGHGLRFLRSQIVRDAIAKRYFDMSPSDGKGSGGGKRGSKLGDNGSSTQSVTTIGLDHIAHQNVSQFYLRLCCLDNFSSSPTTIRQLYLALKHTVLGRDWPRAEKVFCHVDTIDACVKSDLLDFWLLSVNRMMAACRALPSSLFNWQSVEQFRMFVKSSRSTLSKRPGLVFQTLLNTLQGGAPNRHAVSCLTGPRPPPTGYLEWLSRPTETNPLRGSLSSTRNVSAAIPHPNGQLLCVTRDRDDIVTMINLSTRAESILDTGIGTTVDRIALSPAGDLFAAATSEDPSKGITLMNVATGRVVQRITGVKHAIVAMVFYVNELAAVSRQDKLRVPRLTDASLYVVTRSGLYSIDDLDALEPPRMLVNDETTLRAASSVSFFPKRSILAVGTACSVIVLNSQGAGVRSRMTAAAAPITSVDFGSSGLFVLSGSLDGVARVSRSLTGEVMAELFHEHGVSACSCIHSHDIVATGLVNGDIMIWDTQASEIVHTLHAAHDGSVLHLTVDSLSVKIFSAGGDGYLHLWETKHIRGMRDASLIDDDITAVLNEHHGLKPSGSKMTVMIPTENGPRIPRIRMQLPTKQMKLGGPKARLRPGVQIAGSTRTGRSNRGTTRFTARMTDRSTARPSVRPTGRGTSRQTSRLTNRQTSRQTSRQTARTGRDAPPAVLTDHPNLRDDGTWQDANFAYLVKPQRRITVICVDPTSEMVAVAFECDFNIHVYDVVTMDFLDDADDVTAVHWVTAMTFSYDSAALYIATADDTIAVYDTTTWEQVYDVDEHLRGHSCPAHLLAPLKPGTDSGFLSAAADNTLVVWSDPLRSREPEVRLGPFNGKVLFVEFSIRYHIAVVYVEHAQACLVYNTQSTTSASTDDTSTLYGTKLDTNHSHGSRGNGDGSDGAWSQRTRSIPVPVSAKGASVSRDGEWLACSLVDGRVALIHFADVFEEMGSSVLSLPIIRQMYNAHHPNSSDDAMDLDLDPVSDPVVSLTYCDNWKGFVTIGESGLVSVWPVPQAYTPPPLWADEGRAFPINYIDPVATWSLESLSPRLFSVRGEDPTAGAAQQYEGQDMNDNGMSRPGTVLRSGAQEGLSRNVSVLSIRGPGGSGGGGGQLLSVPGNKGLGESLGRSSTLNKASSIYNNNDQLGRSTLSKNSSLHNDNLNRSTTLSSVPPLADLQESFSPLPTQPLVVFPSPPALSSSAGQTPCIIATGQDAIHFVSVHQAPRRPSSRSGPSGVGKMKWKAIKNIAGS